MLPDPNEIIKQSAEAFHISVAAVRSPCRERSCVYARHVAMYLIRQLTSHSYEFIGSYFGGRDHSTVMNGCRRVEEHMEQGGTMARVVSVLATKFHAVIAEPVLQNWGE